MEVNVSGKGRRIATGERRDAVAIDVETDDVETGLDRPQRHGQSDVALTHDHDAFHGRHSGEAIDRPAAGSRSGQPPDPPIIVEASDDLDLDDVPIALFETVTVTLGPVGGGGPLLVEIVTADPQEDPPPLDCALLPCAWGLEEVVFPEWVDVTLGVADVRGVTVVVTRDRDRRVAGRHAMELDDGTATIRLTGLQPGTAYSTEYMVQDHLGNVTTAAVGSFRTAR